MAEISVLMSVYGKDRPEFLERALASITQEQTRPPDEVVLVEDGPLGAALGAVVADWQERLGTVLQRVVFSKNRGLGAALNAGLSACRFPLVARMDSDDVALPRRLARQEALLEARPEVAICGAQAADIDADGRVSQSRRVPVEDAAIKQIIWSCPVIHPSVVFRRDEILALGSYDGVAAQRQEDFELWVRAALAGLVFHNLDETLLHYRVLDSHFSKNSPVVGFNRLRIAFRAVNAFDRRAYAYMAIVYPFVRSLLPTSLASRLQAGLNRLGLDPRQ